MKIAVCVKQVPAGSVKMNSATGALDRSSSGSVINPYDRYAIEAALRAAVSLPGVTEITALSMGPPSAEKILREALAMGASRAILLCDTSFSGSDVSATSRALAGVFKVISVPDLIFCGQQTTDGDTAQLPFALAARLGIPALGWVKKIEYFRPDDFFVLQEFSGGTVKAKGAYPAVFAVGREGLQPRAASLPRRLAAEKMPVEVWNINHLADTNTENYGFAGSPTKVRKIYSPDRAAKNPPLSLEPAAAAALIARELAGLAR